jgi:hypothetical protein
MTTIVTRAGKGSPLTNAEVDANFINLNTGKLELSGGTLTGALTLHADPTQALHAATKDYVDNLATGFKTAPQVRAATTTNLAANYDNGTAGVGATLTADTNRAFTTLDGVTGWATGNGILVKNQTAAYANGRYILTDVGSVSTPWVLTRCSLCDEASEIPGKYFFVTGGTVNADTGWVSSVADPDTFVIGTDAISFYQFSGAGSYTAGTGLTLTGNQFAMADDQLLPSQTGNSAKFLTTNGTTASWATMTAPNNGTLTLAVSGTGLSGSASFTADQAGNSTFTVASNATSANTISTIVARDGSGNFSAGTISAALSGNASTATTLATARTINGVSFNGSANITVADSTKLPLAGGTMTGAITFSGGQTWPTFNQNTTGSAGSCTGNAATATVFQTARTLTIGSTGKTFNGSANVAWSLAEIGAQATLVSGTNIKTVNGNSLLGSGNLSISASAAGSSNQVQYNSGGAFAGSGNLTFDGASLTCGSAVYASNWFRTYGATGWYSESYGGGMYMIDSTYVRTYGGRQFYCDSTITAGGSVVANSDETLKTNWRDLPTDFVEQLAKVKHGTYDRLDTDMTQDGVSAQSLQTLLPNSVLRGEDGKLSVAYGNAALVSAIQLAKRLVALEATVAKLVD